jgi:hypothetical protein
MFCIIFQATRRHTYKLVDHKHVSFILAIHVAGLTSNQIFPYMFFETDISKEDTHGS